MFKCNPCFPLEFIWYDTMIRLALAPSCFLMEKEQRSIQTQVLILHLCPRFSFFKESRMSSATDWIAALVTLALAVMAFITLNATYKLPLPWINAPPANLPNDIHTDLATLRDVVNQQAMMIRRIQEREAEIIDSWV